MSAATASVKIVTSGVFVKIFTAGATIVICITVAPRHRGYNTPNDADMALPTGRRTMTRYMLFLLIVVASTATALAAIAPDRSMVSDRGQNVTVIEKNQAFPVIGPVIVEQCRLEDCSDATG